MDLADRLAQIGDNPGWPPIYRMEAKEGLTDRTGAGLDPASMSDGDIGAALHARIVARTPEPAPVLSSAERAQANADMAEQMAHVAIGDHPDAPDPAALQAILTEAGNFTEAGNGVQYRSQGEAAATWAETRGLTFLGQITGRGRVLLDILNRAAALRTQADQHRTEGN